MMDYESDRDGIHESLYRPKLNAHPVKV